MPTTWLVLHELQRWSGPRIPFSESEPEPESEPECRIENPILFRAFTDTRELDSHPSSVVRRLSSVHRPPQLGFHGPGYCVYQEPYGLGANPHENGLTLRVFCFFLYPGAYR